MGLFCSAFPIELCAFFIHFGHKPLIRYKVCKYFFPFQRLSFYFVGGLLCCVEAFQFHVPHLFVFDVLACALGLGLRPTMSLPGQVSNALPPMCFHSDVESNEENNLTNQTETGSQVENQRGGVGRAGGKGEGIKQKKKKNLTQMTAW